MGMHISKAVRKACEFGGYISRRAWDNRHSIKILPTNTPDCCIIMQKDGKSPCRGWQPTAEDLMADDWEVFGD